MTPGTCDNAYVAASEDHEQHMRQAVALALTAPAALFRSVIVDRHTGEVLSEGANDAATDHPLVHGETDAIDRCFRSHPGLDWERLALYTTAEPCVMCQAAIGWAGISLVVYGTSTPTLRRMGYEVPDIRAAEIAERGIRGCAVIGGILETECDALFTAWLRDPETWPPAPTTGSGEDR